MLSHYIFKKLYGPKVSRGFTERFFQHSLFIGDNDSQCSNSKNGTTFEYRVSGEPCKFVHVLSDFQICTGGSTGIMSP